MKKVIRKWGSSIVIRLSPEEAEIYNLKAGDIVNVEITKEKPRK